MNHIELTETTYHNQDFLSLCNELDHFLNQAIGGESKREKYKQFNHLDTMDYVVLAYDKDQAAGCGALRRYSPDAVELKRVFVKEDYRGQGIGGMMLNHLITYAKQAGYRELILETGAFLEASLRLYTRYGFHPIPNYGAYQDMPESLCMKLEL